MIVEPTASKVLLERPKQVICPDAWSFSMTMYLRTTTGAGYARGVAVAAISISWEAEVIIGMSPISQRGSENCRPWTDAKAEARFLLRRNSSASASTGKNDAMCCGITLKNNYTLQA
jgi:hypothetical protein